MKVTPRVNNIDLITDMASRSESSRSKPSRSEVIILTEMMKTKEIVNNTLPKSFVLDPQIKSVNILDFFPARGIENRFDLDEILS